MYAGCPAYSLSRFRSFPSRPWRPTFRTLLSTNLTSNLVSLLLSLLSTILPMICPHVFLCPCVSFFFVFLYFLSLFIYCLCVFLLHVCCFLNLTSRLQQNNPLLAEVRCIHSAFSDLLVAGISYSRLPFFYFILQTRH